MLAQACALLLFVSASAAQDELRILKNQIDYLNKQNYSEKISRMERALGNLENKIEELSHQIQKLKHDSKPAPQESTPAHGDKNTGEDQGLYHNALSAIKNGQRQQAEQSLNKLIKQHPDSKWISQAYYWLGEIELQKHKYAEASKSFDTVIQKYPKSPKRVDALLKRAMIASDQGHLKQARQLLEKILQDYPEASAAHHARAVLKKIKTQSSS